MRRLDESAQFLKNVGPRRARDLRRLGVETVRDLLYCFPRRYEDRSRIVPVGQLRPEEHVVIRGQVLSCGLARLRTGLALYQAAVSDGSGTVPCTWYNQPYLKDRLQPGMRLIVSGRTQYYGRQGLSVNVADYEVIEEGEDGGDLLHFGRIVPVYPLTGSLTQRAMRVILKGAVDEAAGQAVEILPGDLRARLGLPDERQALRDIHFPADETASRRARDKFAFAEFFLFQLAVQAAGRFLRAQSEGIAHTESKELARRFIRALPFQLTAAQVRVLEEIRADMIAPRPMNRLVQGDVGCGKTVVGLCAALIAIEGGYQAALMVPTETLALQHARTIAARMQGLGVQVECLTGDVRGRPRARALAAIASGRAQLVVGTHALLQEDVAFRRLGLCIVDEQHKFGVTQRTRLQQKGRMPDFLMMTATPIPRSLAITLFGDMQLSVVDKLPRGRKPVRTIWVEDSRMPKVYQFIHSEAKLGRQAYLLYPRVEEAEGSALKAAQAMAQSLQAEYFKDMPVGLVHGRMPAKRMAQVMEDFREGRIRVLVCTTVVEVGVDVPQASVMLVENAERFGLSQLHQLRGRVGRGADRAYCILHGNPITPQGVERLKTLEASQDGFEIAEKDLQLRGAGEFFGGRQHGLSEFSIGDLVSDRRLMERARALARDLVDKDPVFSLPEHALLREALRSRYGDRLHWLRS